MRAVVERTGGTEILTITLGTHASGSTWLYNVVRALYDAVGRPTFGASSNDGLDALDKAPLAVRDIVLKSHGMDQRLLKLARLTQAKVLITVRDPRDSVVSQNERFDLTLHQASMDLSQSLATLISLPSDLPTLRFVYEDRFTERVATIVEVARFLELEVDAATTTSIFDSLRPSRVREQIRQRQANPPADEDPGCDPVTLWHTVHLGDGRVGKWQDKLDANAQQAVSGCLNAMVAPGLRSGEPLRWPTAFFTCNGSMPEQKSVSLVSDGGDGYLAYGPYLCLPRGRWRAVAMIQSDGIRSLDLETDIYLPWEDRTLAHRHDKVTCVTHPAIYLDFDHHDYFQPLEARLRAARGSVGACKFAGWKLFWMGDV